ncbi:MAG: hypothetical protein DME64_11820 [Verrucomicrobia bacterium]|nr:MAG: hypothetical protein DME64_11820 [Verrucomicrobiota bacterium]
MSERRYCAGASREGKQILRKTPKRFQTRTRKGNEIVTCARKKETAKGRNGDTAIRRERCLFADSPTLAIGVNGF